MTVAVVTPYHKEDLATLERAHRSVLAQDCRRARGIVHVMVADGHPRPEVAGWDCQHVTLPEAHADGGSLARGVGALHALSRGATFVAFLDADCWHDPDHVSGLVAAAYAKNTLVTVSRRRLVRLDGTVLEPLDPECDGARMADTSTLLVHRDAGDLLALWGQIPPVLGCVCDHVLWMAVRARGYGVGVSNRPTLNFQTHYPHHYAERGEAPPPGCIDYARTERAWEHWTAMGGVAQRRLLMGGYHAARG